MKAIPMTYDIAMSSARDAANRAMRKRRANAWSEDDYNLLCETFATLYPVELSITLPAGEVAL